jgi:hypothetical protein
MKKFFSFFIFLMVICFFKLGADAAERPLKYEEGSLFVDDLENFEEIVLGQTEDNKNHVTALYEPHKEELTIFEMAQDLLVFGFHTKKISFNTSSASINKSTIYHFAFYNNYLQTINPPPPQA